MKRCNNIFRIKGCNNIFRHSLYNNTKSHCNIQTIKHTFSLRIQLKTAAKMRQSVNCPIYITVVCKSRPLNIIYIPSLIMLCSFKSSPIKVFFTALMIGFLNALSTPRSISSGDLPSISLTELSSRSLKS